LARTLRCATVPSEARNARAISRGRQSPHEAQRERDARLPGQDRMVGQEDQPQHVVLHVLDLCREVWLVQLLKDFQLSGDQLLLALERHATA
jgi:hypothetical protein